MEDSRWVRARLKARSRELTNAANALQKASDLCDEHSVGLGDVREVRDTLRRYVAVLRSHAFEIERKVTAMPKPPKTTPFRPQDGVGGYERGE